MSSSTGCPPDKIRNPPTGRCVSKTGAIGRALLKQPAASRPASTQPACPPDKIVIHRPRHGGPGDPAQGTVEWATDKDLVIDVTRCQMRPPQPNEQAKVYRPVTNNVAIYVKE